jgi:hypothetical protein
MAAERKAKTGDRFGRLVIDATYTHKKSGVWWHKVICDCGTAKHVNGKSLFKGASQSCGCLQVERSTSHGKTKTDEYKAWSAMLTRCSNENQPGYVNYGGRGISVCDRWREFEAFLKDMGRKPSKKHSLERVMNDIGYSPDNCKWADRFCQAQNQRTRRDNKTGIKGVYFDNLKGKFLASMQRNKVNCHLGTFDTLEGAALARAQHEDKLTNEEY